MESSIAVFLERQPACELLPTNMKGHRQSHCRLIGKRYSGAMLAYVFDSVSWEVQDGKKQGRLQSWSVVCITAFTS